MIWPRTIMCIALLAASVGSLFAQCYGFAFMFMLGSIFVWDGK